MAKTQLSIKSTLISECKGRGEFFISQQRGVSRSSPQAVRPGLFRKTSPLTFLALCRNLSSSFPNWGDCKALAIVSVSDFKSSAHPPLLNPPPAMTPAHFPRMPCGQLECSLRWFSLPLCPFWIPGNFPFCPASSVSSTLKRSKQTFLIISYLKHPGVHRSRASEFS